MFEQVQLYVLPYYQPPYQLGNFPPFMETLGDALAFAPLFPPASHTA